MNIMIPGRNTQDERSSAADHLSSTQYDPYTPASPGEIDPYSPTLYHSPESGGEHPFPYPFEHGHRLEPEAHPLFMGVPTTGDVPAFPTASPFQTTAPIAGEVPRPKKEDRAAEPELWTSDGPLLSGMPTYDPWERCKNAVDRHDNEMCKGWTDDVDAMLVFAGLFSAISTSFCVEAYQLLSEEPAVVTNALLLVIAQQATGNNITTPDILSTVPEFVARPMDIAINALYFVSLALALIVASICILCKQWLREYQRDLSLSHVDAIRLRQLRYAGLVTWRVPQILASLPIILQGALLIFACGVLLQLLGTHLAIIIPVAVVGFAAAAFLVITSAAPAHQILGLYPGASTVRDQKTPTPYCPYRSPQAWVYYRVLFWAKTWFSLLRPSDDGPVEVIDTKGPSQVTITTNNTAADAPFFEFKFKQWSDVDKADLYSRRSDNLAKEPVPVFLREVRSALKWVSENLGNSFEMHRCLLWCAERYALPLRVGYVKGDKDNKESKQLHSELLSLHQELLEEVRDNPTFDAVGDESWQLGVELQLKDVNSKLGDLSAYTSDNTISDTYQTLLWDYGLLSLKSSQRVSIRMKNGYIETLDQVALSLRYMFEMLVEQSESMDNFPEEFCGRHFSETITRLMVSLADTESTLARHITRVAIPALLDHFLQTQMDKSMEFAFTLGSCVGRSLNRPEHLRLSPIRLPLFEVLDRFIVKESVADNLDSAERIRWRKWGRQVAEAAGVEPVHFGSQEPSFLSPEEESSIAVKSEGDPSGPGVGEAPGMDSTGTSRRPASRRASWFVSPIVRSKAAILQMRMGRGAPQGFFEEGGADASAVV